MNEGRPGAIDPGHGASEHALTADHSADADLEGLVDETEPLLAAAYVKYEVSPCDILRSFSAEVARRVREPLELELESCKKIGRAAGQLIGDGYQEQARLKAALAEAERKLSEVTQERDRARLMRDSTEPVVRQELCEARAALSKKNGQIQEAWDAAESILEDRPQADGKYVHVGACNGDRRKRTGEPGCCCPIGKPRKRMAEQLAAAKRETWDKAIGAIEGTHFRDQVDGRFALDALHAARSQEEADPRKPMNPDTLGRP